MSRTHRTLLIAVLVLAVGGCGVDRDKAILMAAGSYGDVALVVDDAAAIPVANRFLASFNTTQTFVIKEEPLFKADVFGPDRWDLCKGYKNVLLLVDLSENGPVRHAARAIMSGDSWQRLTDSGGGIVQVNDPWSTYQLAVVVAARDRNTLASVLVNNAEKLRQRLEEGSRERILRRNRYDGLNQPLMTDLWDRFGFFLEIPKEYQINQAEPDGFPGVEMLRTAPSRGVTVAWLRDADPAALLLDRPALLELRRDMGETMHSEELVEETLVWSDATIGGVAALRLDGAWNSTRFSGGGPFRCYFVPDPASGRLFCVDLLVYAPGQEKTAFFRRMDALASTFTTTRPQP